MKKIINKEDIAKKLFNLNRTLIKKRITNNQGKVVEEKDKIICYIKKYKCKKERFSYSIRCHGIRKEYKELVEKYNLNKPICYVIDNLKFEDDEVHIWGYNNCEVIIKNCHFGLGLKMHIHGKCTLENTYIRDLSYLALSATDLLLKDMNISNQLKYSNMKLCIVLSADNAMEINNSNVGRINEKTNVRVLASKQLEIYNSKIAGEIVECESPKIISGKKSIIEAKEKIYKNTDDFYEINITSPSIDYNGNTIDIENKSVIFTKTNDRQKVKRFELINILKKIKNQCEEINRQKVYKYCDNLSKEPISRVLKK